MLRFQKTIPSERNRNFSSVKLMHLEKDLTQLEHLQPFLLLELMQTSIELLLKLNQLWMNLQRLEMLLLLVLMNLMLSMKESIQSLPRLPTKRALLPKSRPNNWITTTKSSKLWQFNFSQRKISSMDFNQHWKLLRMLLIKLEKLRPTKISQPLISMLKPKKSKELQ